MKRVFNFICMVFVGAALNAQITFNACNPIIENQNYTFNQKSLDATGRNVFETDPVIGDQDCGGIGVCEMQIAWNDTENRWEIFADDGNGAFANSYVLYYNEASSTPNPPSMLLGTWVENAAVTNSLCVDGITTLSGDVQDTTLGATDNVLENGLLIYPNPASDVLSVRTSSEFIIESMTIADINGRMVLSLANNFKSIDISILSAGMYFLRIKSEDFETTKKVIVK